jgi:hypothetical protein
MNGSRLAAIALAILLMPISPAHACEGNKGHAYVNLGIGKAGTWLNNNPQGRDKWDDDGGNHAVMRIGYRHPIILNWLWFGVEGGHHSTYDKSPPEPQLDYLMMLLEARLIP